MKTAIDIAEFSGEGFGFGFKRDPVELAGILRQMADGIEKGAIILQEAETWQRTSQDDFVEQVVAFKYHEKRV